MTTNGEAIAAWARIPRTVIDSYSEAGDLVKEHLANPTILRMLGPLAGRRVLDAGCGHGYLARMLRRAGAEVVGVEPAANLIGRARELEERQQLGITYLHTDLSDPDRVGGTYDAVVSSMVMMAIPDWRPALATCVAALRPGGTLVIGIVHPAFEQLRTTWAEHGHYRLDRYLSEYLIEGIAPDFHRPLSAYLNELAALGCCLTEAAEPALSAEVVAEASVPGLESHLEVPNFLFLKAIRHSTPVS